MKNLFCQFYLVLIPLLSARPKISPAEMGGCNASVWVLQQRSGQCTLAGVPCAEKMGQQRRPGEPHRALAKYIEKLARNAYAHMPTDVQNELEREQFIQSMGFKV